jgi:hypothetical protein
VAVASSSKHIIQIVQLLEERRMSFSFCLNKNELLISCGFGLLFQAVDLNHKGKLIQDSRRLLGSVLKTLERNASPSVGHFKQAACAMTTGEQSPKTSELTLETISPKKSDRCMAAPPTLLKSTRKQLQAIACRFSSGPGSGATGNDKANYQMPNPGPTITSHGLYAHRSGHNGVSSAISDATMQRRYSEAINYVGSPCHLGPPNAPLLDYPAFNNHSYFGSHLSRGLPDKHLIIHDPERFTSYSRAQPSQFAYDGHIPPETFSAYITPSPSSGPHDGLPDIWKLYSDPNHNPGPAQSVVSFSEDEGASGEELSSCDVGGDIGGILMPSNGYGAPNGFGL